MEKHSQPRRIISVLMSFILMIEFTGCYTTRVISAPEIGSSGKYLVHCKNSKYQVNDIVISNGILSGKLNLSGENYGSVNKTNIYVSSDSVIKINDGLISLPVSSITKIEQKVHDPGKTKTLTAILIVSGCVAAAVGIYALVANFVLAGVINNASNTIKANPNGCKIM